MQGKVGARVGVWRLEGGSVVHHRVARQDVVGDTSGGEGSRSSPPCRGFSWGKIIIDIERTDFHSLALLQHHTRRETQRER